MIATDTLEPRANLREISGQNASPNSLVVGSLWKPSRAVQDSNDWAEVYEVGTPSWDSSFMKPVIDLAASQWIKGTSSTFGCYSQFHPMEDTTSEAILGRELYLSLQQAFEGLDHSPYLRFATVSFGNSTGMIDFKVKSVFCLPLWAAVLHPIVRKFADGVAGKKPCLNVIDTAARLVQTALTFTIEPEINVDEEDGDIEFDLRLQDGMLVMANLFPDGTIDASVYDDSQGIPVRRVKRLPKTTADELASLLRPVVHASAS